MKMPQAGVEPATQGLGNPCSSILSYWGVARYDRSYGSLPKRGNRGFPLLALAIFLVKGSLSFPSFEEEEIFEGTLQFPLELPFGVLIPPAAGLVRVAHFADPKVCSLSERSARRMRTFLVSPS